MQLKLCITLLSFLFPSLSFGQTGLTKKEVLEDYTILKNVLTSGHPNLYEYTTKAEWNGLFANFEKEMGAIENDHDLYKSIVKLTDLVRDGHLIVMRPQLPTVPKLFPLLLKIIDGEFYTDIDDFGIPVGSEIMSIDGISGSELRNRLLKYAPSDGFNTTKKDRQVEREFGILLFYEFGAKGNYQVKYKTPANQTFSKNIESQPFESIGKNFVNRNSYFSRYHKNENRAQHAQNTLGKKEPFVYFVDSLNTAVLTMNSFFLETEQFQTVLKDIFKEVKRKKVEHLVIDVRQNEGGYPLNCIHAFSYIAQQPFKQRELSHVVTSSLPEEPFSQNLVQGYTYETFFEKYYQNATKEGNKWVLTRDENEHLMVPNKKGFKGKTYVLVGGKTFSAGASFALFCKNEGITLVGEETGGGYYLQTGGYPIIYTLPHSKIKVLTSFVGITRYTKNKTVKKGSGVLPDTKIQLTVEDLIDGKDSQLDHVLRQIDDN